MMQATRDLAEDRIYFREEIRRKGAARVGEFTRRNLGAMPESVHRMLLEEFPELNLPTIEQYEEWLENS
jgi:hypothetical protein